MADPDPDPDAVTLRLIASGVVQAYQLTAQGEALSVPYPASLQRGLDRLTLARLSVGKRPPAGVPELLRWCAEPLGEWMSVRELDANDEVLLSDGRPTLVCEELVVRAPDVEAEIFENEMITEVMRISRAAGSEESYAAFRRFVIEHPVLSEIQFQEALLRAELSVLAAQLGECYCTPPVEYQQDGCVVTCSDCGNLLLFGSEGYECKDIRCPRGTAPQIGRRLEMKTGVRSLVAPVQRFVAAPGRAELRLYRKLGEIGVDVELWPNFDAYDLRVRFSHGYSWAVDVKDWANPFRLARKLRPIPRDPSWDRAFIVPAKEAVAACAGYIEILRARCRDRQSDLQFEIVTERQLLDRVRQEMGCADA